MFPTSAVTAASTVTTASVCCVQLISMSLVIAITVVGVIAVTMVGPAVAITMMRLGSFRASVADGSIVLVGVIVVGLFFFVRSFV